MHVIDLDSFLAEWGFWVGIGNQNHALAIKTPAYAERIGSGAYGDNGRLPETSEEVYQIDKGYRALPQSIQRVLWTNYAVKGTTEKRAKYMKTDPNGWHGMVKSAKLALIDVMTEQGSIQHE